MSRSRLVSFAAAAVVVLALAACGDDSDDASTAEQSSSSTASVGGDTSGDTGGDAGGVTIENFAFTIPESVAAGTVTITNADTATHTFTSDAFDVTVAAGASETIDVEPGTYEVRCNLHPSMTGTLAVS